MMIARGAEARSEGLNGNGKYVTIGTLVSILTALVSYLAVRAYEGIEARLERINSLEARIVGVETSLPRLERIERKLDEVISYVYQHRGNP